MIDRLIEASKVVEHWPSHVTRVSEFPDEWSVGEIQLAARTLFEQFEEFAPIILDDQSQRLLRPASRAAQTPMMTTCDVFTIAKTEQFKPQPAEVIDTEWLDVNGDRMAFVSALAWTRTECTPDHCAHSVAVEAMRLFLYGIWSVVDRVECRRSAIDSSIRFDWRKITENEAPACREFMIAFSRVNAEALMGIEAHIRNERAEIVAPGITEMPASIQNPKSNSRSLQRLTSSLDERRLKFYESLNPKPNNYEDAALRWSQKNTSEQCQGGDFKQSVYRARRKRNES